MNEITQVTQLQQFLFNPSDQSNKLLSCLLNSNYYLFYLVNILIQLVMLSAYDNTIYIIKKIIYHWPTDYTMAFYFLHC